MRCDLTGRVAIVTGAAGEIGRSIARRLADSGAAVGVADIDIAGTERVAAGLPEGFALSLDVRDRDLVAGAVEATLARAGRLDILVNNAGVNTLAHRVNIDSFPREEWERITSHRSRWALPDEPGGERRDVGAGRAGADRQHRLGGRARGHAAPVRLRRGQGRGGRILRARWRWSSAPQGILTNAVAPGSVLTEGTAKLFYGEDGKFAGRTEEFMAHIPLGRPGTPEEIAEAVLFLVRRGRATSMARCSPSMAAGPRGTWDEPGLRGAWRGECGRRRRGRGAGPRGASAGGAGGYRHPKLPAAAGRPCRREGGLARHRAAGGGSGSGRILFLVPALAGLPARRFPERSIAAAAVLAGMRGLAMNTRRGCWSTQWA